MYKKFQLPNDYDAMEAGIIAAKENYVEQFHVISKRKLGIYQTPRFSRIPVRNRISFPQWRNKFNYGFVRKVNLDRYDSVWLPKVGGSKYLSKNCKPFFELLFAITSKKLLLVIGWAHFNKLFCLFVLLI